MICKDKDSRKGIKPEKKGFSPRNLKYMRKFAEIWPSETIVQRCVAQLSWRHNICLMEKVKEPIRRLVYAMAAKYSLESVNMPIGILPSIEEIEAKLNSKEDVLWGRDGNIRNSPIIIGELKKHLKMSAIQFVSLWKSCHQRKNSVNYSKNQRKNKVWKISTLYKV